MLHWLWYGPLVGREPKSYKPQARCGMAVPPTQLTTNERRVTCPRCLDIIHATEEPNPRSRYSPRARRFIARKIRMGAHEGIEAPRRIARAIEMARARGLKVPRRPNSGVPDEGPIEHLKNAAAILQANLEIGDKDALVAEDAKAVLARIKTALQQLERGHVNIGLPRRGNRRTVRRGNPMLAVLGNPRVVDATMATWAKIEYRRPDDPDGKRVIRVHEFKDGFEIGWLSDGSVQLSHPGHPLWTEDGEP